MGAQEAIRKKEKKEEEQRAREERETKRSEEAAEKAARVAEKAAEKAAEKEKEKDADFEAKPKVRICDASQSPRPSAQSRLFPLFASDCLSLFLTGCPEEEGASCGECRPGHVHVKLFHQEEHRRVPKQAV